MPKTAHKLELAGCCKDSPTAVPCRHVFKYFSLMHACIKQRRAIRSGREFVVKQGPLTMYVVTVIISELCAITRKFCITVEYFLHKAKMFNQSN